MGERSGQTEERPASPPDWIALPSAALVLLVGPSGAGKSTFARRSFEPPEILSSDAFRALVSGDENDQAATPDAFAILREVADRRLRRRLLTVVDATNLKAPDRASLEVLARRHGVPVAAIVFDVGMPVLERRRLSRTDRRIGATTVARQVALLPAAAAALVGEGIDPIYILRSEHAVDAARVRRITERAGRGVGRTTDRRAERVEEVEDAARIDRRADHGPFDLIGDVHGCLEELCSLLAALGYRIDRACTDRAPADVRVTPAGERKIIVLGDMVDRGPATPGVLRLVMAMHAAGTAYALLGNHDWKLLRALSGRPVRMTGGLAQSLEQLDGEPPEFREQVRSFLESLPTQLLLDGGRLVAAHAGLTARLQGDLSRRARDFALYGETTGEIDRFGLPVRVNWAKRYAGPAAVVYGHTPVRRPEWLNETIDIDTGCVFGEKLTALRWPERELVSVDASKVHYPSPAPILERIDRLDVLRAPGRPERPPG